jgi:hypothetical protein
MECGSEESSVAVQSTGKRGSSIGIEEENGAVESTSLANGTDESGSSTEGEIGSVESN